MNLVYTTLLLTTALSFTSLSSEFCMEGESYFEDHKPFYGGKTQSQEMVHVRNFLRNEFHIPSDNIEMRFFHDNTTIADIGEYQEAPKMVGITKTGELFHTSTLAEDIFGFSNFNFPQTSYSALSHEEKVNIITLNYGACTFTYCSKAFCLC